MALSEEILRVTYGKILAVGFELTPGQGNDIKFSQALGMDFRLLEQKFSLLFPKEGGASPTQLDREDFSNVMQKMYTPFLFMQQLCVMFADNDGERKKTLVKYSDTYSGQGDIQNLLQQLAESPEIQQIIEDPGALSCWIIATQDRTFMEIKEFLDFFYSDSLPNCAHKEEHKISLFYEYEAMGRPEDFCDLWQFLYPDVVLEKPTVKFDSDNLDSLRFHTVFSDDDKKKAIKHCLHNRNAFQSLVFELKICLIQLVSSVEPFNIGYGLMSYTQCAQYIGLLDQQTLDEQQKAHIKTFYTKCSEAEKGLLIKKFQDINAWPDITLSLVQKGRKEQYLPSESRFQLWSKKPFYSGALTMHLIVTYLAYMFCAPSIAFTLSIILFAAGLYHNYAEQQSSFAVMLTLGGGLYMISTAFIAGSPTLFSLAVVSGLCVLPMMYNAALAILSPVEATNKQSSSAAPSASSFEGTGQAGLGRPRGCLYSRSKTTVKVFFGAS